MIGGEHDVGLPIKRKTPKTHGAPRPNQSESQLMDVEKGTPQSEDPRAARLKLQLNRNVVGSKKKSDLLQQQRPAGTASKRQSSFLRRGNSVNMKHRATHIQTSSAVGVAAPLVRPGTAKAANA